MTVDVTFVGFAARIGVFIVTRIGGIGWVAAASVRVVGEGDVHFTIFWMHRTPFWAIHFRGTNTVCGQTREGYDIGLMTKRIGFVAGIEAIFTIA